MCHRFINDTVIEDTAFAEEYSFTPDSHVCVDCAKKERLQSLVREYTPFMEKFSKLVNNYAFDHDGLTSDALAFCFLREHRQLQHDMIMGLREIITKIGKKSGNTTYEDARNEWALRWCKAVSELEVTL
jgi:hypothetical protein